MKGGAAMEAEEVRRPGPGSSASTDPADDGAVIIRSPVVLDQVMNCFMKA